MTAGRAAGGLVAVPFVVGTSRSGTTLLRLMLDSHPQLAIPPETHFFKKILQLREPPPSLLGRLALRLRWDRHLLLRERFLECLLTDACWQDFGTSEAELRACIPERKPFDYGEALRDFYRHCADKQNKPRWGDKSPSNLRWMTGIQMLLPEAHFIHIFRDGRDVALSIKDLWWGPNSIDQAAHWWVEKINHARGQSASLNSYLEIRYETLVLEPAATLQTICRFIDLPWDPCMLEYYQHAERRLAEMKHDRSRPEKLVTGEERLSLHTRTSKPPDPNRLARWKTEMNDHDRQQFEAVAGALLEDLGYPVGPAAADPLRHSA